MERRVLTLAWLCAIATGVWWLFLARQSWGEAPPAAPEEEASLLAAAFESPVITLTLALCAFYESFLIWGCIQTLAAARMGSAFEIVELEKLLDGKHYSEAATFCDGRSRYYTRLVGAALNAAHGGRGAMQLAVDTMIETEERRGMDRVHALGTLAGVGLLVGLLGLSVNAFHALTVLDQDRALHLTLARASFLAPGFACVVAIPAYLMEATYSRRLPQIHARVRHEAGRLIARIEG